MALIFFVITAGFWVEDSSNMINTILNFIKIQVFVKKILKSRILGGFVHERMFRGEGSALSRLRPVRG